MQIKVYAESLQEEHFEEASIDLERPVYLGREKTSPLHLRGTSISRRHLRLESDDGDVFITDFSANGSLLNGSKMPSNKRVPLENGAIIEVPQYRLVVTLPEEPEPAEEPISVEASESESRTGTLGRLFGSIEPYLTLFDPLEVAVLGVGLLVLILLILYSLT